MTVDQGHIPDAIGACSANHMYTAPCVGKLGALCIHQHWWFEWIMLLILNSDCQFLEKLMPSDMKFFTVPTKKKKKKGTTISTSTTDLFALLEKEHIGRSKSWKWGKPSSSCIPTCQHTFYCWRTRTGPRMHYCLDTAVVQKGIWFSTIFSSLFYAGAQYGPHRDVTDSYWPWIWSPPPCHWHGEGR